MTFQLAQPKPKPMLSVRIVCSPNGIPGKYHSSNFCVGHPYKYMPYEKSLRGESRCSGDHGDNASHNTA